MTKTATKNRRGFPLNSLSSVDSGASHMKKNEKVRILNPILATNTPTPVRPEYIRLPKNGQLCAWTGLGRSKLNEFILPRGDRPIPPVKSFSALDSGKRKGVRLVVLESLLGYLAKLRKEQGAE
jgi:hypothetical protein